MRSISAPISLAGSQLRDTRHDIPIVFITAYDDKGSRGRAMQAGAFAFLDKPFSDEQLLQTVRSALSHDGGSTKSAGWSIPALDFGFPYAPPEAQRISIPPLMSSKRRQVGQS